MLNYQRVDDVCFNQGFTTFNEQEMGIAVAQVAPDARRFEQPNTALEYPPLINSMACWKMSPLKFDDPMKLPSIGDFPMMFPCLLPLNPPFCVGDLPIS